MSHDRLMITFLKRNSDYMRAYTDLTGQRYTKLTLRSKQKVHSIEPGHCAAVANL